MKDERKVPWAWNWRVHQCSHQCSIPISSNNSGWVRGSSTASFICMQWKTKSVENRRRQRRQNAVDKKHRTSTHKDLARNEYGKTHRPLGSGSRDHQYLHTIPGGPYLPSWHSPWRKRRMKMDLVTFSDKELAMKKKNESVPSDPCHHPRYLQRTSPYCEEEWNSQVPNCLCWRKTWRWHNIRVRHCQNRDVRT